MSLCWRCSSPARFPPAPARRTPIPPLNRPRRRTQDDAAGDTEPAPPAAAPTVAPRIPIAGYELAGKRVDGDDKVLALLTSVAPVGEPFIESAPSDLIGKPLGTVPRLEQALEAIGYRATVTPRPAGGTVTLIVTLAPYDRVRYVFVGGNWPVRQDEIQRRITIRPGRPLPPEGPERVAALERERGRIIDFLRGEGYFEANVRLDAAPEPGGPRRDRPQRHHRPRAALPAGADHVHRQPRHPDRRARPICSATSTG